MAALKKDKWEAYARGLAQGLAQVPAYQGAGFKSKYPAQAACKLFKRPEIKERVRELIPLAQKNGEIAAAVSKQWVIGEFIRVAAAAEAEKEWSVVRQCIRDIGDAIHVFDKQSPVKFDWDGDPASLTDSQLEKLKY